MEQDPVHAKTRELVAQQLGYQLLTLCELNAVIDQQRQQYAKLASDYDALLKKDGPSDA